MALGLLLGSDSEEENEGLGLQRAFAAAEIALGSESDDVLEADECALVYELEEQCEDTLEVDELALGPEDTLDVECVDTLEVDDLALRPEDTLVVECVDTLEVDERALVVASEDTLEVECDDTLEVDELTLVTELCSSGSDRAGCEGSIEADGLALGAESSSDSGECEAERPKRHRCGHMAERFKWADVALKVLRDTLGENLFRRLGCRRWAVSSHFSGLGTVEVALAMIRTAYPGIVRGRLDIEVVSSCEKSPQLCVVLEERSGGCVFKDVLSRLHMEKLDLEFEELRQYISERPVADAAECVAHHATCRIPVANVDISGSPCRPWSRANRGSRRGRQHVDMGLFLAWARIMRADRPAIVVHENVRGFDARLLEEELGALYEVSRLDVDPSMVGFDFIRRPRCYFVLALRGVVSTPSLHTVHETLVRALATDGCGRPRGGPHSDWPSWVWRASPDELRHEWAAAVQRTGKEPGIGRWDDFLSDGQRASLLVYTEMWQSRHGRHPAGSAECVFDLGDTPAFKGLPNTSVLPTLRRRASPWWSPMHGRWMIGRERAACMGFPVYEDLAAAARVPLDTATARHTSAVGNCMHVANIGAVILAALCSAEWQ